MTEGAPAPRFKAAFAATEAERCASATRLEQRQFALASPDRGWAVLVAGLMIALLAAGLAVALHAATEGGGAAVSALAFVASLAGMVAYHLRGVRVHARARSALYRATPRLAGPRAVTVDGNGVTLESQVSRGHWGRAAFTDITVEDGLVLSWIGAASVVALPVRALASADERDAPVAFARSKTPAA